MSTELEKKLMKLRDEKSKTAYGKLGIFSSDYMHAYREGFNELLPVVLEAFKALDSVMPFLKRSTDTSAVHAVYLSSAEAMRRQAAELEKKDEAIQNAREAINRIMEMGK